MTFICQILQLCLKFLLVFNYFCDFVVIIASDPSSLLFLVKVRIYCTKNVVGKCVFFEAVIYVCMDTTEKTPHVIRIKTITSFLLPYLTFMQLMTSIVFQCFSVSSP